MCRERALSGQGGWDTVLPRDPALPEPGCRTSSLRSCGNASFCRLSTQPVVCGQGGPSRLPHSNKLHLTSSPCSLDGTPAAALLGTACGSREGTDAASVAGLHHSPGRHSHVPPALRTGAVQAVSGVIAGQEVPR